MMPDEKYICLECEELKNKISSLELNLSIAEMNRDHTQKNLTAAENENAVLRRAVTNIGEYTIRTWDDWHYWIEHDSGEGQQVTKESLAKAIDDFYKLNF